MQLIITLAILAFAIYMIKRTLDKKVNNVSQDSDIQERFLKEAQGLLDKAAIEPINPQPINMQPNEIIVTNTNKIENFLESNNYNIIQKSSTIDFITKKEKKIALIKELKNPSIEDIKIFIADCLIFISKNEIYSIYEIDRFVVMDNHTIEIERFLNENRAIIKQLIIE